MRSVVVVLPASMCAMIPMFRVFSRLNLRGMKFLGVEGPLQLVSGHEKGPSGPVHDATVGTERVVMEQRSPLLDFTVPESGQRSARRPGRETNIAEGMGVLEVLWWQKWWV